ncbi:unnamed protein product [Rotaria sordida]|uniref:Tautomerase cis-CaaD-like domain-containing protein n=1 Tax=Rotaria sordida TaxID=392033 RepID=A0A819WAL4_9BILA|nr:unnamed protein product [Rotaria sordida]CAF1464733.1 unnamed protein product [Rotaria sordida]CAF1530132.1 unnamed protein product [Rotaria sordida]CAF4114854.1 unnamed protein product [Rotaria sordida]CAF4120134.1 unnamed protein product [Rotaria sordida]
MVSFIYAIQFITQQYFPSKMPLHRIFHPLSAFSSSDKKALSERITALYTEKGLPAFYVVVLFIPIESDSFFVGGKSTDKFVRIIVQHLARQLPDEERKKQFSERYENALAPFIKDKGYDWEVHVEEVSPDMWRENGLIPPIKIPEMEKEWARLNKPIPY